MTPAVPLPPALPEAPAYPAPGAIWVLLAAAVVVWLVDVLLRRRTAGMRTVLAVPLAMLVALFMLFNVEFLLRGWETWRGHASYRVSPQLIWITPPNLRDTAIGPPTRQTIVSTNSLGLRDLDVPFERQPGEFRILCVGDSWTFGSGVRDGEAWPKRLQAKLRDAFPARKINVVNAGQSGFSYFQGYYLLRQILPIYHPDLVLMGGFNPVANTQVADMEESLPASPASRALTLALRQSRLYLLLRKYVMVTGTFDQDAARPRRAAEGVRYLEQMADLTRSLGIPTVFFYNAFEGKPNDAGSGEWYMPSHNPEIGRVPDAPNLYKVAVCPGVDVARRKLMQPNDPFHPNARGQDLIAEGLMHFLIDKRLIGTSTHAPARPAPSPS